MSKIPVLDAIRLARETLGWAYLWGASGANRQIDCSGEWVRIYRAYSLAIYHGSNSQYRKYCAQKGRIVNGKREDGSPIPPGCGVFKCRPWAGEDNKWCDTEPGNLYHVGIMDDEGGVIHATTPVAKRDSDAKAWHYWAWYDQVIPMDESGTVTGANPQALYQAVVVTNETGLNFRRAPSMDSGRVESEKIIPKGATVNVLAEVDALWAKVEYKDRIGYVARAYLQAVDAAPEGWVVEITGFEGRPITSEQAIHIADEYRAAGYEVTVRKGVD